MEEMDIQALQKQVRKAKRIASERAAELHDLVEERLPAAYEEIPEIAKACYEACYEWAQVNSQLQELEALQASDS